MRSLTTKETHIGSYLIQTHKNRKGPDSHIVRSKDPFLPRAFTMREETPGRWKVSESIALGKRRRERFRSPDLITAIQTAEEILYGKTSGPDQKDPLEVCGAFENWLEVSQAKPETKQDYSNYIEYFLKWLGDKFPRINLWSQIRLEHLRKYSLLLSRQEKSGNTIRLYCLPIRATARYMAANCPETYHDFSMSFKLPKEKANGELLQKSSIQCLPIYQAVEFIAWLREQSFGWKILPGVALQSLMALRVLEVMRLKWSQINLEAGALTVEGEVKNSFSLRRLPMPMAVLEILKQSARDGDRVIDFTQDRRIYAEYITKAIVNWNLAIRITAKDLRKTIPTIALDEGWSGPVLERFLGHSPQTVTTRYYFADAPDRMLEIFRTQVTNRIDSILERQAASQGTTGAQNENESIGR